MNTTFLSLSSFHQATRALLCVQHLGHQHFTRKVLPPFLQQLLLSTVMTIVVTGSTLCFFTVSLSFSLFVPVLGSGPAVYLQDFSHKGWATTPSYALFSIQPSRLNDTPPDRCHTRARASSPCSMPTRVRLVMSQANGLNILLSPRCMYS